MSTVLPESYTFQREKLIEPIRKASVLRSLGIPINASAEPFQNTTVITTITDDPQIAIAPEPISGVRTTNQVSQVRKEIPTISAPVSYKYDELLRINNGILPFDRRMEILAKWIADREEAHAFAVTSVGVRDSDAIPFLEGAVDLNGYVGVFTVNNGIELGETVQGGTSTETGKVMAIDKDNKKVYIKNATGVFTAGGEILTGASSGQTMTCSTILPPNDFSLKDGTEAVEQLGAIIGDMIERYGTLKTRPLILAFNSVSYARAIGLVSTKTDLPFFVSAMEMILLHGGPGSGIVLIPHLGNAMTSSDDVMIITNSPNETMALMLVDVNHFEIVTSRLDQRSDGVSQRTGLAIDIIERWFPYVHDALSIRYELDVTIT